MTNLEKRLRAWAENSVGCNPANAPCAEAADEIARLRAELDAYREAAQYDAMMGGPAFKGWNRSALDRARAMTEARITAEADPR